MKILVIGGGGREHALAWKLRGSPLVDGIVSSPGNPGMAALGPCLEPGGGAASDYLTIAEQAGVDLTLVGPEAPLVAGVVDAFRAAGKRIIGPTAASARLEGSKVFAKAFLERAGVPTARACTAADTEDAARRIDAVGFPVVLKADGLAAGKGVIIAQDRREALAALRNLPAGKVVLEEFLRGEEVSFIVYADGERAIPLEASQDHKAIFDGDQGPNTGGMGAYCDGRILTAEQAEQVMRMVIRPALALIAAEGAPYSGFLYAGLMMTGEGPKVLEFNVRLGDPECQALVHRMESDLVPLLVDHEPPRWQAAPSVCVVLAAAGYPGTPRKGDLIEGLDSCGAEVFHAGTRRGSRGLETAGGRVLGVTASGADLPAAIDNVYAAVRRVRFDGMQYRTDIARKGLRRW